MQEVFIWVAMTLIALVLIASGKPKEAVEVVKSSLKHQMWLAVLAAVITLLTLLANKIW